MSVFHSSLLTTTSCVFSDHCHLLLEMTLSLDFSWLRWKWQTQNGFPQSPSESTPLLSPDMGRQSYNPKEQRVVYPNNGMCHQDWKKVSRRYPGNSICTTKYTLLTFLPQNLFEQFHRYAARSPNYPHLSLVFATETNSEKVVSKKHPLMSKCTYETGFSH